MSLLTESGRKTARAQQRNYLATTLRRHEWFAQVPQQVVGGFAELLLVSRELRARIKIEGVQRADGSVNPVVEQFRKFKHTELAYLQAMAEMRRAEHEEPRDLVAEMARCDEAEPVQESIEPSTLPPQAPCSN
jgi:hypothetical protein